MGESENKNSAGLGPIDASFVSVLGIKMANMAWSSQAHVDLFFQHDVHVEPGGFHKDGHGTAFAQLSLGFKKQMRAAALGFFQDA